MKVVSLFLTLTQHLSRISSSATTAIAHHHQGVTERHINEFILYFDVSQSSVDRGCFYNFVSMGLCWTKLFKRDGQNHKDEIAGGNVHLITNIDRWEEKLSEASKDGKLVVANFSAVWCSPCKMIAPSYRELADKYTRITFLTVDVDVLAEFSTSWDIKATPTFFFLKDGRQLDKLVGANKAELVSKLAVVAGSANKAKSRHN